MTGSLPRYPSYSTTVSSKSTSISEFPQKRASTSSELNNENISVGSTLDIPSTKKFSNRCCEARNQKISSVFNRLPNKSTSRIISPSVLFSSAIFFQTKPSGKFRSIKILWRQAVPTTLPKKKRASSFSLEVSHKALEKNFPRRFSVILSKENWGDFFSFDTKTLRSLLSPTWPILFGLGASRPSRLLPSEFISWASCIISVKTSL
mmetsp:Transcript_36423/g.71664  ORF Transcript_36423/g.71664 Transcript_36423/m.71664 type:complete len:206 (+) Transcript_36423:522-1139(+)